MNNDQDKKPQKDVIRPHVADGIQEYDNPLPSWWVGLFWGTIVFGLAYLIWYHVLNKPGLDAELQADRQSYQEQKQAQIPGDSWGQPLELRLKDSQKIAEGKDIYLVNCAACHGQLGEGVIGPNLTDKFWIHGGAPENIIGTVTAGVPSKGMVAWESTLGPAKIEAVVAFVLSLQGSNPPNAKAPEGDEY